MTQSLTQLLTVFLLRRAAVYRATNGVTWGYSARNAWSSLLKSDADTEAETCGATVEPLQHLMQVHFHADAEPERWDVVRPWQALAPDHAIAVNNRAATVVRALPSGLTVRHGIIQTVYRWHAITHLYIF